MKKNNKYLGEKRFQGDIALNYKLITDAYPDYPLFIDNIINTIKIYQSKNNKTINVIEIGCGYGATTRHILSNLSNLNLIAIDNEPLMVKQAKIYLNKWNNCKHFSIIERDALLFLKSVKSNSVDIIVSELTIHNFNKRYRHFFLCEIFRVLSEKGCLVNADKYSGIKTKRLKSFLYELKSFYILLIPLKKYSTFAKWVFHHISDQSPNRIMKFNESEKEMKLIGFYDINILYSGNIISVLHARKP